MNKTSKGQQSKELVDAFRLEFWKQNSLPEHALFTLVESYLEAGAHSSVTELLNPYLRDEENLEYDPPNPRLHSYMAQAYELAKKPDLAALQLAQLCELRSEDYYPDSIADTVSGIKSKSKRKDILSLLERLYPKSPYVLMEVARSYADMKSYKQAEKVYREVRSITTFAKEDFSTEDIEYTDLRFADVLISQKKYDEGFSIIEELLPAISDNWDLPSLERKLADNYFAAGEHAKAIRLFEKFCYQPFDPSDNALAMQQKLDLAVETYRDRAALLIKASKSLLALNRHDEAIVKLKEILTDILKDRPEYRILSETYSSLRIAYEGKNDFDTAKEMFRKECEFLKAMEEDSS